MNTHLKHLSAGPWGLAVVLGWTILISFSTPFAQTMDKDAPAISYAFNDSPEHQAVIKLLQELGQDQILRSAYSVGMSKGQDFADVFIEYYKEEEPAKLELFLFKENGVWKAYKDLPTGKDHYAVFATLARQYCQPLYKNFQGASLLGDTWKSDNPKKRTVNVVCSELVDNKWQDDRLTFVYEYDETNGWRITGQSKTEETAGQSPAQASKPTTKQPVWGKAKDAIAEIIQTIGGNPQPVFIMFGTAGKDFIQCHYVSENDEEDIQTVEWKNGKTSKPKASRLARPCPKIPFGDIDFNQVPAIYADMNGKAMQGDLINVNLSRRFDNGCQEPVWQGIATSGKHSLTVTYSLEGKQIHTEEYKF